MAKRGEHLFSKRPQVGNFDNLDFSFSGLKTAVLNTVNNSKEIKVEDICVSFEEAVFGTEKEIEVDSKEECQTCHRD